MHQIMCRDHGTGTCGRFTHPGSFPQATRLDKELVAALRLLSVPPGSRTNLQCLQHIFWRQQSGRIYYRDGLDYDKTESGIEFHLMDIFHLAFGSLTLWRKLIQPVGCDAQAVRRTGLHRPSAEIGGHDMQVPAIVDHMPSPAPAPEIFSIQELVRSLPRVQTSCMPGLRNSHPTPPAYSNSAPIETVRLDSLAPGWCLVTLPDTGTPLLARSDLETRQDGDVTELIDAPADLHYDLEVWDICVMSCPRRITREYDSKSRGCRDGTTVVSPRERQGPDGTSRFRLGYILGSQNNDETEDQVFHLFGQLLIKVRLNIWAHTWEPRTITLFLAERLKRNAQGKFRRSATRTSQAFEMLNTIRSLVRRVMAIGLSASVTKGPDMWRPFVQHHFNSREVGQLQGLGLEKYQTHYTYLVNNLGKQQVDNQAREERNVRQGELLDFTNVFMPQFMPQFMLARTRISNFRGQRIRSRYAPMRMKRSSRGTCLARVKKIAELSVPAGFRLLNIREEDEPELSSLFSDILSHESLLAMVIRNLAKYGGLCELDKLASNNRRVCKERIIRVGSDLGTGQSTVKGMTPIQRFFDGLNQGKDNCPGLEHLRIIGTRCTTRNERVVVENSSKKSKRSQQKAVRHLARLGPQNSDPEEYE
ncbi:hypothetical protein FHL15_008199 [Xylaria flabelliformis]|uniref:Uncharacterized protein n=1 Tax=Xylaria flabelliformis TaxID=2512241 RepID=A0A553HST6_9PEZI|nr:hypothetical protein FHL15_008199 [Xylaria flabelliformis]